MRALDLFAGVGGITLGLERAGVEVVAACELSRPARGVYAEHWPAVPVFPDVRELRPDDLRTVGPVDLITAGFPCQDLSLAGHRAGLAGPRSALFWHILRLAAASHARWLLLENVPGLLSSNGGRDMGAVLGGLGQCGYGWAYRVLDAQFFGVAQRRRRVFIVGCLGDRAAPVEILFEPEGSAGHSPPVSEAPPDVAGTLGSSPEGSGWRNDLDRMTFVPVRALTANGLGGGGPDDNLAQAGHLVANPITAHHGHNGPTDTDTWLTTLAVAGDYSTSDDVAQPIRAAKSQPGAVAGSEVAVRRLTPLECERLQGLPDGWTAQAWGKPQSDSMRYRQLGNTVAVPVVEWVAQRLMRVVGAGVGVER